MAILSATVCASEDGDLQVRLVTDMGVGFIDSEQRMLRRGYDLVFVGGPLGETFTPINLVPDPAKGSRTTPLRLERFTNDPAIVAIAKVFMETYYPSDSLPAEIPIPLRS